MKFTKKKDTFLDKQKLKEYPILSLSSKEY